MKDVEKIELILDCAKFFGNAKRSLIPYATAAVLQRKLFFLKLNGSNCIHT